MFKYGLKLWTSNQALFNEAVKICNSGQADLIELYIVPGSFKKEDLAVLQGVEITIHAPHFEHDFNIFTLDENKINFFKKDVSGTADFLQAKTIVVHAGVGDDDEIFQANVKKIHDPRIIIENKPKTGYTGKICYGYTLDQLKFIRERCGYEICFDIVHAVKSSISQKIYYKIFLESAVNALKPKYFHLCGTDLQGEFDDHFDIFKGDLDWPWIKNLLAREAQDKEIILVFEVPKINNNLANDLKNIEYFKNIKY